MNQNDTPTIEQPPTTPPAQTVPASERAYVAAALAGRVPSGGYFLDANEFTSASLSTIYEAVRVREQDNQPVSVALLVEELAPSGDLLLVGGAGTLETLLREGEGMSEAEVDEHGQTIRKRFLAKKLYERAQLVATVNPDELEKAIKILAGDLDTFQSKLNITRLVPLTNASALRAKLGAQKWLWEGYIPIGHVTVLISQQGQGKSNVALDLCHRLATTGQWPDGTHVGDEWQAGDRIFYLDAEGFLQGILSRMEAWGTPDEPFIWPEGCDQKQWALNTSSDWQRFESLVAQYRPRFIVIDSLSGANTLEEKDNDQMKALILNMVALTQKYRLALVLVHHKRKAGLGEPSWPITLDSSRGASAITQFPRVVHAIGTPDAIQPTARRFETIKNNLMAFAPALGFEISDVGLLWGEAPDVPKSANPISGAKAFLLEFLGEGRRYSDEVKDASESEGLSWRTIERASKELHVQRRREMGKEGRWYWQLPGQQTPLEQFDEQAKGLYEE